MVVKEFTDLNASLSAQSPRLKNLASAYKISYTHIHSCPTISDLALAEDRQDLVTVSSLVEFKWGALDAHIYHFW